MLRKGENNMNVIDFSNMFLYTLCNMSENVNGENSSFLEIELPYRFKDTILCLVTKDVESMTKYSNLIDMEDYFRGGWELYFSKCLDKLVNEVGDKIEYNLERNTIILRVNVSNVEKLYNSKYSSFYYDTMKNLVNNLYELIYSRSFMLYTQINCYQRVYNDYKKIMLSEEEPVKALSKNINKRENKN